MTSIRFASVNIERHKHISAVLTFVKSFNPDVLFMQELLDHDIPLFEKEFGMVCVFAPMTKTTLFLEDPTSKPVLFGTGIFTKGGLADVKEQCYFGDPNFVPVFIWKDSRALNYSLLSGVYEKDGVRFQVATTHFIWTPDGNPTEDQRDGFKKLSSFLNSLGDVVFAGDLNAPRGREIFDSFAKQYTDNIPKEYTTSIDKNLHRAGDLGLMVDGLFTSPHYVAREVKLTDGVSDHMAISAVIERVG